MARAVNNITKRTVKEKYFMAFGLAFIVACALFVPYIIWDKGYFIFYGDFNAQQIPFYKLAHAAVRNLDILAGASAPILAPILSALTVSICWAAHFSG